LLLNNLYTIQSLSESDNQIEATLHLVADHAIFNGHFPGQPVLPGVCMMEMVSEVMGVYLKSSFRISGGPLIKFLRMIDPRMNPTIHLEIKYQPSSSTIITNGRIFSASDVFMKFQLNLVPEPVI
jgi:3-hydroxyacyl-[acyl-carrier-protein] dehydratase